MSDHILVISGHPDPDGSLSRSLAKRYAVFARKAGAVVRLLDLSRIAFDPILHKGYSFPQELEPALKKAQRDIAWANHIVIVYPNWWGSMPALLKGFFDRVFSPGFAFTFDRKKGRMIGLLKGKTARIILLMRQPPKEYRKQYPYPGETVKHSILEFCGIRHVAMTEIGPSEKLTPAALASAMQLIEKLGSQRK